MSDFSLPRTERLSAKSYIKQVFKQGKKVSYRQATLFFLSNGLDYNRFLCTFKRGFGSAVLRNKVRRISKEFYRLNKHKLKSGFDVVLLLGASNYDFSFLKDEMSTLFEMAKLLISKA